VPLMLVPIEPSRLIAPPTLSIVVPTKSGQQKTQSEKTPAVTGQHNHLLEETHWM
jgi:hypothetical protein